MKRKKRKNGGIRMKNKITIRRGDETISFYLHTSGKCVYLFSQKFTKGVYEFFKNGRSENEIKSYRLWKKNPRLDKTITKIPLYTRYALKYEV